MSLYEDANVKTPRKCSPFRPKSIPATVRQLADELLVYDPRTCKAHCLNETAAQIWRLCDGTKTVSEIATIVRRQQYVDFDEATLWIALTKFADAGLLQNPRDRLPPAVDLKKRRIMKVGAMAATLAVPTIASILVPKAEAAASCATVGQSCNSIPCCTPLLICVANLCVGV